MKRFRIRCNDRARSGFTFATGALRLRECRRFERTTLRRAIAIVSLAATALAPGSVVAEGSAAAQDRCVVDHQPFMEAGVAHGRMRMVNDGQPCGFAFRFGMKFDPSSWRTDVEPRHGRLHFDGARLEYLPDAGYTGADAFTVTAFGMNPMTRNTKAVRKGQFAIEVDVQAAVR